MTTVAAGSRGRLWGVVGATGTGKSEFALSLAEALARSGRAAEVVNSDAMQLYRGMDIGTAKLTLEERRGIPHHMLDVRDVVDDAAVAWYQAHARAVVEDIFVRGHDAILVGGSGLYVSSVLFDFRFPPRDEAVRARWEAELAAAGPAALYTRLQAWDAQAAARIDPRNERRVVRALEVLSQGSQTHRGALPEKPELWNPRTHLLGLEVPRDHLVTRLDERVRGMWDAGLLDEVTLLRERGLERGLTASRAIGYAQALAELKGEMTRDEAITQTQALTRRYARRQVSWFRRYPNMRWVHQGETPQRLLTELGSTPHR